MAEKYCTYLEAASIGRIGNSSTPTPPSNIQTKIITKENLKTYNCKVSETAKINYTNKQCVLKTDTVPIQSGEVKVILTTEYFGMLDGGGEFAFTYVTKPGPYEVVTIDDYGTSFFYPTNTIDTIDVSFPHDNTYTHYSDNVCGGSTYYMSDGKGYVEYGMGIGGSFSLVSYYTGNNIVYMSIVCNIYFSDGTVKGINKTIYPKSSTIIYQDSNETVYQHDFKLYYNEVTGPTFISCGRKQVKEINALISIFGQP